MLLKRLKNCVNKKFLLLQVRVGHFHYLIYFLLLTKIILIILSSYRQTTIYTHIYEQFKITN